jgi:hypothetical protein
MSNDTADILARIDAVTCDAPAPAEYMTEDGDVVTSEAVHEAAIESAATPVIAYDPILGPVAAESYDQAQPVMIQTQPEEADEPEQADEQDADDAELRAAIIDDQMNSAEGRQGTADWQGELRRRERERQAREEALERAAEVRAYIASYLVLPPTQKDAILDILTLWSMHTYSLKAAGVTPYLFVVAATQGAGKTRVLEVLSTLVNNPSRVEVNPTAPVVRLYANEARTLFLDEIDMLAKDQSFVAVANSGYRAGGSVTRVGRAKERGQFADSTNTFCPKAFAGIAREGSLPLPSATLDRGLTIRIVRATPEELRQTKRFRVDVMRDETEVVALRDWMTTWSHVNYATLRDAWVDVPQLSTSRAMEVVEPLIGIADALGADWGERARNAVQILDGEREQATDPNAALIADVREVLTAWMERNRGTKNIPVEELVNLRNDLDGRQLTERLNPIQFGKRLGAFGIKSTPVAKVRVYRVADEDGNLLPVWADLFNRF